MKLNICIAASILLSGCSQPPDFTEPNVVTGKTVVMDRAKYQLRDDSIGFKPEFYAPQGFAEVGDVLIMHRGALRIKKDSWKEEE